MRKDLFRLVVSVYVLSLLTGCMSVGGADFDLGFLASRDTDLNNSRRARFLGPLIECQQSSDGSDFSAVRPVFSHVEQISSDKSLTEIVWPVGMFKDFGQDRVWRFLPFWGNDYNIEEDGSRCKFNIFPILFSGRDKYDELYFAIFPIGGTIHEVLGRDEVFFTLFPLYARSKVRDVVSHDILWPFISWSKGNEVERLRILPFYGKSTNLGRWQKRFIMWPFWTDVRYDYEDEKGSGFVLFPLYGHARAADKESWMILPPLFRYSTSDTQVEANLPYPLIQYASGDVNKLYLWPLWGKKSFEDTDSFFFLWPIIRKSNIYRAEYIYNRFDMFPLMMNDTLVSTSDNTVASRYFKLWPLFSYRRENDASRLRMLDLWITRDRGSIDRNFAPLWTLFSREKVGDSSETELLWGLYRSRRSASGKRYVSLFPLFSLKRAPEENRWNILCGFFGVEKDQGNKTYRLLYFLKIRSGNRNE